LSSLNADDAGIVPAHRCILKDNRFPNTGFSFIKNKEELGHYVTQIHTHTLFNQFIAHEHWRVCSG
ncbi:MAG: hypothetical protein AAFR67_07520, partial [Chloroflexota bacterium]